MDPNPMRRAPPGPPPLQQRPDKRGHTLGMPGEESMILGMIAHGSQIPTSFIGPLIIWLWKRDSDEYVAYHALQALSFSVLTLLLLGLSCGMGSLLLPFLWLYALFLALSAKEGEWIGYPLISWIGKKGKEF